MKNSLKNILNRQSVCELVGRTPRSLVCGTLGRGWVAYNFKQSPERATAADSRLHAETGWYANDVCPALAKNQRLVFGSWDWRMLGGAPDVVIIMGDKAPADASVPSIANRAPRHLLATSNYRNVLLSASQLGANSPVAPVHVDLDLFRCKESIVVARTGAGPTENTVCICSKDFVRGQAGRTDRVQARLVAVKTQSRKDSRLCPEIQVNQAKASPPRRGPTT